MRVIPETIPRSTLRRRRQQVEACLAGVPGPRRFPDELGTELDGRARTHRLRLAIESLGAVFASFGIYLSRRVDLLPAADCLDLGTISDLGEALPPATVEALIRNETGRLSQDLFYFFEEKPFDLRLMSQSHRAQLADGQEVVVRIIHPELSDYLQYDIELLPLLRSGFASESISETAFESAVDDFSHLVRRQIDCFEEAKAFDALLLDAREFGTLRVPFLHRSLCSSRMLTFERLSGRSLSDVMRPFHLDEMRRENTDKAEFASRVCTAWLRQAFLGRCFPVELTPANISILPSGQIAFTGVFESLSHRTKANLFDYLIATASSDPDRAFSFLFRELMKEGQQAEKPDLMRRFRQVVPLRDNGWTGGDCNGLAAYLFTHWGLASKNGYLPPRHLSSFYVGLFIVENIARRLAPERDTLAEALRDVQLLAGLEKVRDQIDPRRLSEQLERYGPILMSLPQRLDEVLTLAEEGRARLNPAVHESVETRRRMKNYLSVVVTLLLVLAAFVLLSHRFAVALPGAWVDSVNAVVFVALAGVLLWLASRV
jgi:ubiquinone biosynthesis protein